MRFRRAVLAVPVAMLAACSSSSSHSSSTAPGATSATTASGAPLRMLMIAPLSSAELAPNAETAQAAAQAAVAYVNAHGGVLGHQVQLTVEDDAGNPTTAVTKLQNAINSGSKPQVFLQADASPESSAELPILNQNKILSFNQSPTATSGDPAKFPLNFDLSPSTANYAEAFCPYVKAHGGKSVAILHGNDAYGDALGPAEAAACTSAGVKVTGQQQFELTALDMTPQLEALQSGHPDFLILQAFGSPAGYVLKDIQKLGWNVPILGDDSVIASPVITSPPPTGLLGSSEEAQLKCELPASSQYQASPWPGLAGLLSGLKSQGPIKAPLLLANMYDGVILAAAGAQKAGTITDASAIAKAIETLPAGTAATAMYQQYHFSSTSHSPNVDPTTAFVFVAPSKLVDGQFGGPGA